MDYIKQQIRDERYTLLPDTRKKQDSCKLTKEALLKKYREKEVITKEALLAAGAVTGTKQFVNLAAKTKGEIVMCENMERIFKDEKEKGIEQGETKEKLHFKYIIVDEYQDISRQRFDLTKALSEVCDGKIIAVGDDWQSIYAFSGSDISLFTKFQEKMGYAKLLKIIQTYRNAQDVIQADLQNYYKLLYKTKEEMMMNKMITFIKKETVLVIASMLAICSVFFVPLSKSYIGYIDFRVLGILLSLMIVMAGFQENKLFMVIGNSLLRKTKNTTQLSLILVFLPFFFSMFITNDVSLITFVPFSILTLRQSRNEKIMIPVIVLQTIAANMGSMLTPIGNPQNLYLYNLAGIGLKEFVSVMLPYVIVSGIVLICGVFLFCRGGSITKECAAQDEKLEILEKNKGIQKNIAYLILFNLCLFVVGKILPWEVCLLMVIGITFLMDKKVLKKVDYCLILTFVAFFIFTGNLGQIQILKHILGKIITGKEVLTAVFTSQCISNVPAALMLSGFTTDPIALLKGVNIGGLGTLIASMASLISYKIYAYNYNDTKGKYLVWFTVANLVLLLILFLLNIVL